MASLRRHARLWLLRQHKNRMAEQTQEPQTAFERVQLARHPDRPNTLYFVERLFEDFTEIHGDRRYSDDSAVVCGFARFHGMPTLIDGHQTGLGMKLREFRNYGMPQPVGNRNAIRPMRL